MLALVAATLVMLFAVIPHTLTGDGYSRFVKIDTLLRLGVLRGDRYSYLGPLFASPFWLFGSPRATAWWVARFNVLVLALGVLLAWRTLRPALTSAERASFLLLVTVAGMMPNASRDFYGEMFSTVMAATGLMLVSVAEKPAGWILVVLGVANMPASAAGLLLVAVRRLCAKGRFDALLALMISGAVILLENTIARGSPLNTGYLRDHGSVTLMPFSGRAGFSYPLILGVLSLSLSFGKGLCFFAPGLLFVRHVSRTRPQLRDFLGDSTAFLLGLLLVYSQWWAWYGGWMWGPRFLLFATYPASLALAISLSTSASASRSLATVVIAVWTVWVGISGAVFDLDGLEVCAANEYALEHLCWFVPEFSPIIRPLVLAPGALAAWQWAWVALAGFAIAVVITSGPALGCIVDAVVAEVRLVRGRVFIRRSMTRPEKRT